MFRNIIYGVFTNMKKIMLALALVTALTIFSSCTASDRPAKENGETLSQTEITDSHGRLPHIADYTERDIRYTATVSDGTRSVTLLCERIGGVTTASVTSPEELSGLTVIYDAEGLRLRLPHESCSDVYVSDVGAAGLTAIFDALKQTLGKDSFSGGREFDFDLGGVPVRLTLSPDGLPQKALVGEKEGAREVTYTFR